MTTTPLRTILDPNTLAGRLEKQEAAREISEAVADLIDDDPDIGKTLPEWSAEEIIDRLINLGWRYTTPRVRP